MTKRNLITVGLLVFLGFAVVVAIRFVNPDESAAASIAATPVRQAEAPVSTALQAASAPAKTFVAPAPQELPADPKVVGKASGTIHFQRQAQGKDDQGKDHQGARIDFDVHSALGVWQPGEKLMRILLLEAAPKGEDVARTLDALQSGGTAALAGRTAVIELRFIPTAQAFDRNELDSARLIVSDGSLTSSADALNSLDWQGSLPSPQLELPPGSDNPTVALSSTSESVTADRETWLQSWKLSLDVPVILRK